MYKKKLPDKAVLREAFDYKDGKLIRRHQTSAVALSGQRAGCLKPNGYRFVGICCDIFLEHRLIWAWHYGDPGELEIDHINRVRNDNRIENLRAVTSMVNHRNYPNTHKAGVDYRKKEKLWRSRIKVGGRSHLLGYFKTHDEALKARHAGMQKHWGVSP